MQFIGVLAVPSLVAAAESPRAMWMAEWLNPVGATEGLSPVAREREGRTIGVLRVRDGKLSFVEQIGQVDWELDLANVTRIAVVNGGPSTSLRAGKALSITSVSGEEFVVTIMDPNLTQGSPKKAMAIIERAVQSLAADSR